MEQTTEVSIIERVAIKLLGWRWMREICIPIKGTPNYPQKQPVREFMPPSRFKNQQWIESWNRNGWPTESDGTEPLAYCYCSSGGYDWPGQAGDLTLEVEKELRKRNLFRKYLAVLPAIERTKEEKRRPHIVTDRIMLEAALMVCEAN